MELLNHIAVLEYHPTGSKYICNPPVLNTDEDWVVLYPPEMYRTLADHLAHNGYYRTNRDYFESTVRFTTWRSFENNLNLILTDNEDYYRLFVEATMVAKEENLLDKADRVACFEMIMSRFRKNKEREEYTYDVKGLNQRLLQNQQAYYNALNQPLLPDSMPTIIGAYQYYR